MENNMTAAQLIAALQKLKPDAEVCINIKQQNKVYGVIQLPIKSTMPVSNYEFWVSGEYTGATITVHLPEKHFLTKRK